MTNFINELTLFLQQMQFYLVPWLIVLGCIWAINIFNWIIGSRLNMFGVYPRHLFGLIGIPISPILHGNFNHLFFNSVPLFVLGLVLLTRNMMTFVWVTAIVTLVSGLGVWIFGRKGFHIGASGVISGYFGYLLMTAYTHPSFISILLAIFAAYYFGGIFLGLFPDEEKVSWEGHVFGFLAGVGCAYLPWI